MRKSMLAIGLAASLSIGNLAPAARPAEQILADYNAVELVRPDQKRIEDKAYMEEMRTKFFDALKKRADFAKELYEADAKHPQAMQLMQERMQTLFRTDQSELAMKEIDGLIAAATDPAAKATFQFMKGQGLSMSDSATGDTVLAAAREFIATNPTDPRGAALLSAAADRYEGQPDKSLAIYREVDEKYGNTPAAMGAKGKIKQVEGIGKPFELSFTDAASGQPMSMADLKGKVVVIDFWATWCGPCVAEMPHMKEIYAKYKDKGVEFIGISLDQPESQGGLAKLKEFVVKENIPWPQYYQGKGWQSDFSSSWGINSIPALFVVDQKGNLYDVNARGKVEQLIEKLLGTPEKVGG
jgi:thiol-disulfide isomerase/thioredoxin